MFRNWMLAKVIRLRDWILARATVFKKWKFAKLIMLRDGYLQR